jgi:transcription-repair coupling factor (superfamily II helicase)
VIRLRGLVNAGAWAYAARLILHGRSLPEAGDVKEPSGPLVLAFRDEAFAARVADDFEALAPVFGAPALASAVFGDDPEGRLAALERLAGGARLVLLGGAALKADAPDRESYRSSKLVLKPGLRLRRAEAIQALEAGGYARVDFVGSPGDYAARGAVLDFYPLEPERPVRALFDEDSVVSLRVIDLASQETVEFLSEAAAIPVKARGRTAPLARWLDSGSVWIVEEALFEEGLSPALTLPLAGGGREVRLFEGGSLIERTGRTGIPEADLGLRAAGLSPGALPRSREELARRAEEGWRILLYSMTRAEDMRLEEALGGPRPGFEFLVGPLHDSFSHPGSKLLAVAAGELFGRSFPVRASRGRPAGLGRRGILRLRTLKAGDFVSHADYGIARYRGLKPVSAGSGEIVDCLQLEFRGGDKVYLPVSEFSKVDKYVAIEGTRPRLSSLERASWERTKLRVREGVRELAQKLIKAEAARRSIPGIAFAPESEMERSFAASFPYDLTPDQARAIEEVLADLRGTKPMDRLVAGDVGFGKTEVAMRAAFAAAASGRQAALLVPTTILAEQHADNFRSRMADYPVRVAVLTRFNTRAETKMALEGAKTGAVDIVVGTARLLQKDVAFHDLALVVVDEEHRFGVKDKEKLRALRRSAHCLFLSATPIPRTLFQALSGLRSLSLIQTPPLGRKEVSTRVAAYDESLAVSAIVSEVERGGQVYYVHNRVRTLPRRLAELRAAAGSGLRFSLVHGQMRPQEIEKAMWEFYHRKADVLVASSIIEAGLDIPSVNTLVVEHAEDFGLSQLYQLRGRVGREKEKAHCLLFFGGPDGAPGGPPAGRPAASSLQRLEALQEFAALGSGFWLAMRDIEIRGSGELLGMKQHGFMAAIGLEGYTRMLEEEISRLRGRVPQEAPRSASIDIALQAFIPEDYLPNEFDRLDFYKRLLASRPTELPQMRRELEDLCGPFPPEVKNLFVVAEIRSRAQELSITKIEQRDGALEIRFREGFTAPEGALDGWLQHYGPRLRFLPAAAGEGPGLRTELAGVPTIPWIEDFLERFGSAKKKS